MKQCPSTHVRCPPSNCASGHYISLQCIGQLAAGSIIQRCQIDRTSNLVIHHRRKTVRVTGQQCSTAGGGSLVGRARRHSRRCSRRSKSTASRGSDRTSRTTRRGRDRRRSRPEPRRKQRARRHRHSFGSRRSTKTQDSFEAARRLIFLATTAANPAARRPQQRGRIQT